MPSSSKPMVALTSSFFVLELYGIAEPLLMHKTATTEKNPLRQAVGWFIYIIYSKRLRPT
jgi:hypothetical protein